jgi:hypothetical protein
MTTALIFSKIPLHRRCGLRVLHVAFHVDLRLINAKTLTSNVYSSGVFLMKLGKVFLGGHAIVFLDEKVMILLTGVLGNVSFGQRMT